MTREDLIKLARLAVAGIHRPEDCENPVAYDPPEWVVEAMAAAWKAGTVEAKTTADAKVAETIALVGSVVERYGRSPPPVPEPSPSSSAKTPRMKRKR